MAEYTVLLCDSLTDAIIGQLPASSISFGESLNGPGTFTVTTALNLGVGISAIEPLRQSVYILRDDVPVFGGILWTYNMSVAANSLTIAGAGFWSLVRRRRIRTDKVYVATDQTLIAKDIVDDLQALPNGDMLIDTSAITACGVLRDRTYLSHERKNAGEAVEQLAAVRQGFDFAVRPAMVGGLLKRQMSVSYPASGRVTNIVLDAGTNVELLGATGDATTMVGTMHGKGEGEGAGALLRTVSNATILGSYPLVEELMVLSDVKETDTLDAHLNRALDLGKQPMVIPSVVTYGDLEPVLGSYVVGDQMRVRASYGLLNIDATYRNTQWQAQVDENGAERVTMTFAPLGVFADV